MALAPRAGAGESGARWNTDSARPLSFVCVQTLPARRERRELTLYRALLLFLRDATRERKIRSGASSLRARVAVPKDDRFDFADGPRGEPCRGHFTSSDFPSTAFKLADTEPAEFLLSERSSRLLRDLYVVWIA